MIGISYFVMTQLEAAVERRSRRSSRCGDRDLSTAPTTMACWVRRSSRLLGLTSKRSDKLWRSRPVRLARRVLTTPRLQTRFQTGNEEAAATMLRQLIRLPHNLHPWGESWQEAVSATRIPLHLPSRPAPT